MDRRRLRSARRAPSSSPDWPRHDSGHPSVDRSRSIPTSAAHRACGGATDGRNHQSPTTPRRDGIRLRCQAWLAPARASNHQGAYMAYSVDGSPSSAFAADRCHFRVPDGRHTIRIERDRRRREPFGPNSRSRLLRTRRRRSAVYCQQTRTIPADSPSSYPRTASRAQQSTFASQAQPNGGRSRPRSANATSRLAFPTTSGTSVSRTRSAHASLTVRATAPRSTSGTAGPKTGTSRDDHATAARRQRTFRSRSPGSKSRRNASLVSKPRVVRTRTGRNRIVRHRVRVCPPHRAVTSPRQRRSTAARATCTGC